MMRQVIFWLSLGCYVALFGCTDSAPTAAPSSSDAIPTASSQVRSRPSASTQTHQSSSAQQREQTTFGAEEEIVHPVPIPKDVLQILRSNERNQRLLAKGQKPDEMPASWFVASEINLKDDSMSDLIVMAVESRLLGANIVPFWNFRNTLQGHELALTVSALSLEVLDTKTNGYRDIRTSAATAKSGYTIIFKFDGKEYREQRQM